MDSDLNHQREIIHEQIAKFSYEVNYKEVLIEKLSSQWHRVDQVTKILVALTTSGSAFSGLALWNQPGFKVMWAIVAGIASLLSVIQSTLQFSQRAKMWSEVRGQIVLIRRQIDALLEDMEYFGEFDPETIREQFRQVQDDYAKISSELENDILLNQQLRKEARSYVNELLGDNFKREE